MKNIERVQKKKLTNVATNAATGYAESPEFKFSPECLARKSAADSIKYNYSRLALWLTPLFLTLVTILFYRPSWSYNFQFDDLANIVKFFDIRQKTLRELFFSSSRWIAYWLSTIYYALAKHFFGDGFKPYIYRVGSNLIHLATGILVFCVVFMLLRRLRYDSFFSRHALSIASFCSALFLLHPVQTQTVSYVIQAQLEGLAGLFLLLMIVCFLRYTAACSGIARWFWGVLLFVIGFLACGTKEIAIVAPFILVLVDWFFVAQGSWLAYKRRLILHVMFLAMMWGVYIYLLKPDFFFKILSFQTETRNNIGNVLTDDPLAIIRPFDFCISQFKVILHYLSIFIWPFTICVDYDWKISRSFFAPDCLVPLLILCVLAGYLLYRLYRNPKDLIAFAFLWFFILILPRSSIIPSTELIADYKTYAASIGIYFLLAAGIVWLLQCLIREVSHTYAWLATSAFFVIFSLSLGFLTYERNKVWRSPAEFWWNIVQRAPDKARAYNNYGVALSEQGNHTEAIAYYKKAIAMDRNYPDPCNNLAVNYAAVGELDNAIAAIKMSIKLQPLYPESYNNLASFLIQKKEYAAAERALQHAIKLRPYYGKAYFNLARICVIQGRIQEAYQALKQCCTQADFDNELGFSSYGNVCIQLKKFDEACFAYENALRINPGNTETARNLLYAYLQAKIYDKAHYVCDRLLAANNHDSVLHFNKGEVYFAEKNYEKALVHYERAEQLNPRPGMHTLARARCMYRLGKKAEAKKTLKLMLLYEQLPQDVRAYTKQLLTEYEKDIA